MASSQSSPMLFLAGALSGVVETLVVQPLDMVKTRFQLNEGTNHSVVRALRGVVQEGGFCRFYRGILPELVGNLPAASAMLATYEMFKRTLTRANGGVCDVRVAFASGFLSGYTESVVVTPFQVVKVRMQAKEYLGFYRNSLDCIWKLIRTEGLSALMIGLGPSIWRNCTWNSIYFACLFQTKFLLPQATSGFTEMVQTFFAGAIAGAVATVFAAPFDLVKSRFQKQQRPIVCTNSVTFTSTVANFSTAAGTGALSMNFSRSESTFSQQHHVQPTLKYRHTLPALATIWRTEGMSAVYKGLTPKLLRMTLGGGVCMTAFEVACTLLPKI